MLMYFFENIHFIIDSSTIKEIEYLKKHKHIKADSEMS